MALFEEAVDRTLKWEGGYATNPKDPGGETLFGIARKRHPEWSGWSRVDELKKHFSGQGLTGVLNADGGLLQNAKAFYEEEFWHYDDVDSQAVANKVFDMGVNMGPTEAVKLLQRAVGVPDDGAFGPKTLEATNSANAAALIDKLRDEAETYYYNLIAQKPDLLVFWNNWKKRAQS